MLKLLDLTNKELRKSQEEVGSKVSELEREISKQQLKLDRLYLALETGKFESEDLSPRIRKIRSIIEDYTRQKLEFSLNEQQPLLSLTKSQLKEYVKDVLELLSEGSFAEQKNFIRSFIKNIVVDNGKVIITYTFPIEPEDGGSGSEEVLGSDLNCSPGRTILELSGRL